MNGMYPVTSNETIEEAKMDEMAHCSPLKYERMSVVAMDVLVMATLMDAAMHRTQSCTGIKGKIK